MRRTFFSALLVIILGSFFIFTSLEAASSDIVINEIGAYEPVGQEWIELFNRGTSSIDLTGWKFFDTTTGSTTINHALKVVSSTDSIISPGEYAIITQDASKIRSLYPWVTGSIFEASWLTLNESGEEIGLVDPLGTKVEDFTYISTKSHSLERKDVFIPDYSALNWFEHPSSNTIGLSNWITQAPTSTPTSTVSPLWSQIKINEVMPDPDTGDEWVELYNPTTSSLDLTGGMLCDNRAGTCTIATLATTIAPQSWVVVTILGNKLNNSGDSVLLKNPDGTIVDQVTYAGALAPKTNQTLARKNDGVDTDNDTADFALTLLPTPGGANSISAPPSTNPSSGGGGSVANPTPVPSSGLPPSPNLPKIPTVSTNPAAAVFINEIFPNPEGSDTKDEFIELKNQTGQEVSVQGWKLVVGAKYYQLSGTILPYQFLVLPVTVTRISLRNAGGDEVLLYATGDVLVDRVVYGSAPSGKSFARADDGKWFWTTTVTKGAATVVSLEEEVEKAVSGTKDKKESGVVWDINVPKTAPAHQEIPLSVGDTEDKEGRRLAFTWSFSDTSSTWSGAEIKRSFEREGKVTGTITASSTSGVSAKKTFTITVTPARLHNTGEIVISEVLVNPEGADKDEFIELFNPLDREVNLDGWQIKLRNGKKFVIEEEAIQSDEYMVFKQARTKLSLNNAEEVVTLLDADEREVDKVRIVKSPEGKSYSKFEDVWKFSDPTPGKKNVESEETDEPLEHSPSAKTKASGKTKKTTETPVLGDYQLATIAEARPMLKGARVIVPGVVITKPGALGAKVFYLTDEESGIAVYAGRKNLPSVKVGDRVEVQAAVSLAGGAPRLTAHAITLLESGVAVDPEPLEDEPGEELAGQLVQVQGEVTKAEATRAYLDTEAGEVQVSIKKSTGLTKSMFEVGETVEVTGIVEETKNNDWQLLPRGKEDLKVIKKAAAADDTEEKQVKSDRKSVQPESSQNSPVRRYSEIGLGIIGGALLVKLLSGGRAAALVGALKKLVVKKEDEDELL